MSTPSCGRHCRPASSRDPYGHCCKNCHGRRFTVSLARAVALAFLLETITILLIAAVQELVHHVLR